MKILIGMTRSDTVLSGAFIHIYQLGSRFKELGHKVTYVLGGSGPASERLKRLGFEVIQLPHLDRDISFVNDFRSLFSLTLIMIRYRPDVCSWHTAKIGAIGRACSGLLRVRSYYVAHGVPFADSPQNKGSKLYQKLERFLAILPCKIVCVCKYDFDEFKRIGVNSEKLLIIRNGMRSLPEVTSGRARQRQCVRFVTAARFERQKDYDTLLDACRLLSAKSEGAFEMHIYGDGPLQSEIRTKFAELEHAGVANFHGVVEDFSKELPLYDVFVLSSHWEGLPRSIIEAMASGLPIVATNVGGVSELVVDGKNGHLVNCQSPKEFAIAMELYICDKSKIDKHGIESRKIFNNEFTLDSMLKKYQDEYLSAI